MATRPNPAVKTLLVTGFGAFPGVPSNPSEKLIARLVAAPPPLSSNISAHFHLLPVTWAMLEAELPALYEAYRPDAVVHFGVASKRRMISIEARARNAASLKNVDAAGLHFGRAILAPDGPAARPSTLPVSALVSAVTEAGVLVRRSRDAGDYLCNATLWTSLTCGLPSVFVHIPHPGEDASANDDDARPSLDGIERAARAVLACVAGHITA